MPPMTRTLTSRARFPPDGDIANEFDRPSSLTRDLLV